MKNYIEYFFFRIGVFFTQLFPLSCVQAFGRGFGLFVFHVIPIRKALVFENLTHAFPKKSRNEITALAKENYKSIFCTFMEILWLSKITEERLRELVTIPNAQIIDSLLSEGKGLIAVGGHFGSWELGSLSVGLIGGHPITIIVQRQRNPLVDAFMTSMREKFDNIMIVMERAPREIFRAIQNNKVVGMLVDQSGPESGIYVNYFGRLVSTHQGPAVFAVRTGAPMMMSSIIRQPDGKFITELKRIVIEDITGTDEEKIQKITERHVAMMEEYVRRFPEQWLWMHKRWKHADKAASMNNHVAPRRHKK